MRKKKLLELLFSHGGAIASLVKKEVIVDPMLVRSSTQLINEKSTLVQYSTLLLDLEVSTDDSRSLVSSR